MDVAVGSTNPVKIAAAEAVLRRIYGSEVRVQAIAVESGVSPQPWGDEETRRGALAIAWASGEKPVQLVVPSGVKAKDIMGNALEGQLTVDSTPVYLLAPDAARLRALLNTE